ncbi:MAG: hypothetical protein ACI37T_00550 [Candidatus Gastranaerophilaceae bacterium]
MKQNPLFIKGIKYLNNSEFRNFQQTLELYFGELKRNPSSIKNFYKGKSKNYQILKKSLMKKLADFSEEYNEYLIIFEYIQKYLKEEDFNNFLFWKNAGENFKKLQKFDLAYQTFLKCLKVKDVQIDILRVIGDLLYFDKKDYQKAIKFYEKYLEFKNDNAYVYNVLGCLYEKCYKSSMVEKQIEYFEKAHYIGTTDKIFIKNAMIIAGKNHCTEKFFEYREKLLQNNPTHGDLYDCACWSLFNNDFETFHKYFHHRFFKENDATLYDNVNYKLWNGKEDISGKKLLVNYEQGFGDSILCARFLPELEKLAPNFVLKIQDPLYSLFKYNYPIFNIVSSTQKVENNGYDFQIPFMNLLSVFNVSDKHIPCFEKYLNVADEKIQIFKQNYINTEKFKVGIAFKGNITYQGENRDIPVDILAKITRNKDIQVYSLQVENNKELFDLPESSSIIDLGSVLTDFEQTAAAIKNMDLIVSTDNVVMNLSGALGVKTFGLFNYYTDYRWFVLENNNTGWYKSIKVYQNTKYDEWLPTFEKVLEDIRLLLNK